MAAHKLLYNERAGSARHWLFTVIAAGMSRRSRRFRCRGAAPARIAVAPPRPGRPRLIRPNRQLPCAG